MLTVKITWQLRYIIYFGEWVIASMTNYLKYQKHATKKRNCDILYCSSEISSSSSSSCVKYVTIKWSRFHNIWECCGNVVFCCQTLLNYITLTVVLRFIQAIIAAYAIRNLISTRSSPKRDLLCRDDPKMPETMAIICECLEAFYS